MKKLLAICLFMTTFFVVKAQNKITGTKDDFASGVPYFDKVNFEITYQVVEDRGTIRVKLSNPKIFVHPDAKYNYQGKFYSRQDLGLANWPQTQKPTNFGVYLSVQHPGGTVNHMFSCTESGICKDNNDYILASNDNKNNYKPADFQVSYHGMMTYNGQGNDQVERLISAKTATANTTANASTQNPLSSTPTATGRTATQDPQRQAYEQAQAAKAAKAELTAQVVTQVASLAGELLNDWNANREKRIAAERAAYEQAQSIEAGIRLKKYEEKFIANYLPLMDKAIAGDERARMTLYFASASLYCKELVPLRDQWFEKALANNNTDAIVEVARITAGKQGSDYDFKKAIPYLEKAASLGNVDAMVILGCWYSIIPMTTTYKGLSSFLDGGQNPKLALEMFKAAAERGSPNAMYYLGMIYKYGQIYDLTIKKYNKAYTQFDVILDEKVSLDWFMKSLNPSYEESLYSKSLLHNGKIYYETSSYFNPSANYEISISIIYNKKGKVNPGHEEEAKEFEKIRTGNTYEMINKQKFKN